MTHLISENPKETHLHSRPRLFAWRLLGGLLRIAFAFGVCSH